jgi:hypothetical protein
MDSMLPKSSASILNLDLDLVEMRTTDEDDVLVHFTTLTVLELHCDV